MVEGTAQINSTASPLWARTIRLCVLFVFAAVCVLTMTDSARSWWTRHVLEKAAQQAARVNVSTPLNVKNCRDATPCPVQWAAAAARQYLMQAGVTQAACINPHRPDFSGVLIWVFSCDGSSSCQTSDSTVCINIDMTPVARARNGEFIPFTQVTVQCPHDWVLAAVLKLLPGKPRGPFPRSVSASAVLRNYNVS
jgi:hypothetical protein